MIVQPDFAEHWKTRLLVQLTGDESAPMAVIRLWAHCQHSRRSFFPDMTRAQLSSICHWGQRTPACHVALVKAGFVEKLKPRGFAAHQWSEHNAQLIQKWHAGQKGGRPANDANNSNSNEKGKPTDNRPTTGTKPDPIRSDPIDQIDRSDPTSGEGADSKSAQGKDLNQSLGSGNGVEGMVADVTRELTPKLGPSLEEATEFAKRRYAQVWSDAERWVQNWFSTMDGQRWQDRNGKPIANWKKNLHGYCDVYWRKQRLPHSDRNAGTYNEHSKTDWSKFVK